MRKQREVKEFKNVKEIIYNSAKEYSDNVAFIKKEQINKKAEYTNITYKDLLNQINYYGTKLYDMGLKNKRIAIVGRNRYEWVLAHLTNLLGGIVSIPLDKDLQIDELENSLIRSKADAVVFDEKYIEKIQKIKERSSNIFVCSSFSYLLYLSLCYYLQTLCILLAHSINFCLC